MDYWKFSFAQESIKKIKTATCKIFCFHWLRKHYENLKKHFECNSIFLRTIQFLIIKIKLSNHEVIFPIKLAPHNILCLFLLTTCAMTRIFKNIYLHNSFFWTQFNFWMIEKFFDPEFNFKEELAPLKVLICFIDYMNTGKILRSISEHISIFKVQFHFWTIEKFSVQESVLKNLSELTSFFLSTVPFLGY